MNLCQHCEALVEVITAADNREPRVVCDWHETPQLVATSARDCILCRNIWDVSLSPTLDQASKRYPGLWWGNLSLSLLVRDRLIRGTVWWASLDTLVDVLGEALVLERTDLIGLSSQSLCWERAVDLDSEAESRVAQMSKWLRECKSSHTECIPEISPATSLPARLLEVPQASSGTPIRLIRTDSFIQDGQAKQSLRYATLSYCWGSVLPIRTTKSTLHQFEIGIPEQALPKTFRDAVRIVRALGIEYLWIDALCILQDDGSDWQHESAKMMDIYSGSVLTIAASEARDSTGGCFQKLSPEKSPSNHGTTSIFPIKLRDVPGEMTARLQRSLPRIVQRDTHLNTRGWTFQERILSHRIVHCIDDEMHWECRRSYKTQAGHEA